MFKEPDVMNRCGILKLLVPREQSPTPKNGIQRHIHDLAATWLYSLIPCYSSSRAFLSTGRTECSSFPAESTLPFALCSHCSPPFPHFHKIKAIKVPVKCHRFPETVWFFYGMHSLCISSKACIKFYSIFYLCTCLQLHRLQCRRQMLGSSQTD